LRDFVTDKTRNEALAFDHAVLVAVEFISEQMAGGVRSSFAQWPRDAYLVMIECPVTGFAELMQELKGAE
jgi:hypothetical protein